MRILHVVSSAQRRGAEMFTYDLARAFSRSGVEQQIAVLRNGDAGVDYEPSPVFLGANGANLPGLRIDVRAVGALRRLVKQWSPDVIQAYGGEPLKYTVGACIGSPSAIVYRKIGSAEARVRRGARRSVHAGLVRRARRVVAVAESMRREAIDVFRLSPDRVVTIPRGIDPARLWPSVTRARLRRSLGVRPDAILILSLGALTWEKDPVGQIRVASRVLTARPDAYFVVAGEGPLRGKAEAAIAGSDVASRIMLLGSRSDVADLLAASDMLLLASVSEGMPGVVIEAGMAGRPVVAYAISGVPEVVVHAQTGLLAPPRDEQGLSQAAISLAADPALRRRLGRRARTHCRAHYDIGAIAARYLALYEQII